VKIVLDGKKPPDDLAFRQSFHSGYQGLKTRSTSDCTAIGEDSAPLQGAFNG
jgi:hypothetical protein